MTLIEAAKSALVTLQNAVEYDYNGVPLTEYDKFIDLKISKLESAIEEAEKAEPVAWLYKGDAEFDGKEWHDTIHVTTSKQVADWKGRCIQPLYTAPPETQEPLAQDAEQYGSRLNDAAWAAVHAWDEKLMGPMSGAVFNNIKGVVRAAIIKYLEKST
jgi:hypothetical protein